MVGNRSSSSSEGETDIVDKDLLQFYQKKFEDYFRRDDKYREKVDKHLKALIADRYELESEVNRKGEKISNLQKAVVELQMRVLEERGRFLTIAEENERLKKSEEELHKSIRNLLSHTKDRELSDRIIYILQDPKVAIHLRHVEGKSSGTSTSVSSKQKSASDQIKDEIQLLQSKIDEYSRISKNNSEVILEDCKIALEKSKEKILEDEQEMRKLQKKLQESEAKIQNLLQSQTDNRSTGLRRNTEPRASTTSSSSDEANNQQTILSNMGDIKFSLASLTQFLSKMESLLKNIKSSETFVSAANQPASAAVTERVAERDVADLQDCIRTCTRLSYELKNIWTAVARDIVKDSMPIRQRDMQQFDSVIDDLAVSTAEVEILCLGLSRAKFFEYLVNRTISLSNDNDSDTQDHTKCAADVVSLEDKVKSSVISVKTATDIIERISRNIDLIERLQNKPEQKSADKQTDNQFSSSKNNRQMSSTDRRIRSEPIGGGEVTRRIDKALSKIRQIATGEYARDDVLCQHLAEQIRALSDRLKTLYEEFDERNVQHHFNEYSAVTLSKLETLAKQSRDTVIAAEAQITAYRSNARVLSEKLRDTQELLRESINECLGVKRKLAKFQLEKGAEDAKNEEDPCQTFLRTRVARSADKATSPDNPQQTFSQARQTFLRTKTVQDRDNDRQTFFRTYDLDGNETTVKRLAAKSPRNPKAPFECMFCKQDHKMCIEEVTDLKAEIRKLSVKLKLLEEEDKKEKKICQIYKDASEKVNLDLEKERNSAKETIAALEARNASLMDELKVLRNRLKNMERFRKLEIEGFETDIKNLKRKLSESDRHLARAMYSYEKNQNDMELLKTIHETAKHSKSSITGIKRLKAKLYEIEREVKRL